MKLAYPAIFYEGDGGYAVVVPDLPGCCSGGETLAEAILMGIDAASGWVLGEFEEGKPAPKASNIKDIKPDEDADYTDSFVSVIVLDMDSYAAKYGSKFVQLSLEIPEWLDSFAEKRQINCSKVLQDSLMDIYARETQTAYA